MKLQHLVATGILAIAAAGPAITPTPVSFIRRW